MNATGCVHAASPNVGLCTPRFVGGTHTALLPSMPSNSHGPAVGDVEHAGHGARTVAAGRDLVRDAAGGNLRCGERLEHVDRLRRADGRGGEVDVVGVRAARAADLVERAADRRAEREHVPGRVGAVGRGRARRRELGGGDRDRLRAGRVGEHRADRRRRQAARRAVGGELQRARLVDGVVEPADELRAAAGVGRDVARGANARAAGATAGTIGAMSASATVPQRHDRGVAGDIEADATARGARARARCDDHRDANAPHRTSACERYERRAALQIARNSVGVERRAADERAVDVGFGHQRLGVARLDRAAVLDADRVGGRCGARSARRAAARRCGDGLPAPARASRCGRCRSPTPARRRRRAC